MVVRSKTRKRLVFVLVVVVSVVSIAATYFFYKRNQRSEARQQMRVEGIALVQEGQYYDGLHRLGSYLLLGRSDEEPDPEVLLAYAKAREHVEELHGAHIFDAIDKIRQALSYDSANTQAKRDLMRLYTMTGLHDKEAMERAEGLLANDPSDAEALWSMSQCLTREGRYQEALTYTERYTALGPMSFRGHMRVVDLMHKLERSPEQVTGYCDRLLAQAPDEVRFRVLAASAGMLLGDADRVKQHLEPAIEAAPPDVDTARQVYSLLANLQRHKDYRAYLGRVFELAKTDERLQDKSLTRTYLRTTWEGNRYQQFLAALKDYTFGPTHIDSQLLALRVWSIRKLGRDEREAEEPLAALAQRKDRTAEAWSIIFNSGLLDGDLEPARAVEVCQQAVGIDEHNPYLTWLLGNAHAAIGDADLAVIKWSEAARNAPGWSRPVVSIAKHLRARGDLPTALRVAERACLRSPYSYDAIITYAEISSDLIDRSDAPTIADLRQRIETARSQAPNEARLVMVYAKVLTYQGDDNRLKDLAEEVLRFKPAAPVELLLRLAQISLERGLGLGERLLDRAQSLAPNSPQVALAQALFAVDKGDPDKGRQIIERARKNSDAPDRPGWRIAVIRFETVQNRRSDAAAWASLADDFPEVLEVQKLVLAEPVAWQDPDLIDRTIDRLQQLAGDRSLGWRIYRARWLIGQGGANEVTDARKMLEDVLKQSPNRFDALVLLARCYHIQGNTSGAIEQYKSALGLRSNHLPTKLALANLYLFQNDRRNAVLLIEQVAAAPGVRPAMLRSAAALAVSAERIDLGLQIAQAAQAAAPQDPTNDLLLANIYRLNEQADEAEAIYRRVLSEPTPAAVELISDYYASRGRLDEARATLAKLDATGAPTEIVEIIRGTFELSYGEADQALAHYQAAVDAAPQAPAHWGLLLSQQVRLGRHEQALANLERAAKACPTNKLITTAQANRHLLEKLGGFQHLRPLLVSMVSDARNQTPAIETLKVLEKTTVEQVSQREVELAIRRLAELYPRYLPIQIVAIRLVQQQGRIEQAALLARQTMQAFPEAVEPAYLAADLYSTAGNWNEALEVSKEWRRRARNQGLGADLMMARASVLTGKADQALQITEPYIEAALADPQGNVPVIISHCNALIADGRKDEVEKMLVPRLGESPAIRGVWMRLALFSLDKEADGLAWLDRVQPFIASDPAEQVAYAQSFRVLGERFNTDAHLPRAHKILEAHMAVDDPPVEVLKALALLEDYRGNKARAVELYRRVLARDDADALVMNNLAMLLYENEPTLNEAHRLSARAAELAGANPAVLDTLARVLSKMGRHAEAARAMSKAVQLNPSSFEMWVQLGHYYADAEDFENARKILDHIAESTKAATDLPLEIRQRINGLRNRVPFGS